MSQGLYRTVDLRRLKHFAAESLPADSILRELILSEPDRVSATEFCVKSEVWLTLLHVGAAKRQSSRS